MVASTIVQDEPAGFEPTDIWSGIILIQYSQKCRPVTESYNSKNIIHMRQCKTRMMKLAEDNPDIFEYHEGMNGGTNASRRGSNRDAYEGYITATNHLG